MSQGLELLNGLSEEEIAMLTSSPTVEEHIVIGTDRIIRVPDNLKRIAVQFDHNVETVTFDCPRYWDNHDMSKMIIYINYVLPDGTPGQYIANNIAVDSLNDRLMHFTWTIRREVTQIKGGISFLVCIKKTNAEGNEENHWNSELNREMSISEGLECESTVEQLYPDIVTQLLLRMTSVEDIAVTAAEIESLLAQTRAAADVGTQAKNDALAIQNEVEASRDEIRNSYANAIKGQFSGSAVLFNDVSPLEHGIQCRVRGKNLFDISKLTVTTIKDEEHSNRGYISNITSNSVTITTYAEHSSNGYTITGKKLGEVCPGLKVGDTFTLSATTQTISRFIYLSQPYVGTITFGGTYVATEKMLQSSVILYGYNVSSGGEAYGDCVISNIQVELGSVVTEYEPYINPTSASIKRAGKNLLPYPHTETTRTVNGVTFTDNADGTVTVNGTPTINSSYSVIGTNAKRIFLPAGTTFAFYGGLDVANSEILYAYLAYDNGTAETAGELTYVYDYGRTHGKVFTVNEDSYLSAVGLVVRANNKFSNTVFKPQLEIGSVVTDFESPVEYATSVPAVDGMCTIKSVSPNMSLMTNTPGVTMIGEYNRDTAKVIDERVANAAAECSNVVLLSPGGKRFNLVVDDSGTLSATAIA